MTNPLRSLAARITLLVFLATVVSSLTVSLVSLESLQGFLRQKIDQRFPQIAHRVTDELDQWYDLRAREIEVFAGSAILTETAPRLEQPGPLGDRARREAEQYLRYVLDSFPQFERLVIASPTGTPLVEVGADAPLPGDLLATIAPPNESARITSAHRHGGRLVQVASAPMRDVSARTLAHLYAVIDFSRVRPLLTSAELGDTAQIFLVDAADRFLDPPEGIDPGATYRGESVERDPASAVAYYDDPRGERVVGTRMAFPRFGWTLVIEQPYEEAFAPIVDSLSRVAFLNVAIVLGVGLLAFRIAGSIVKPLRALSEAANRLSRGEREVEIDQAERSTDEVRSLTRAFNEMSQGLGRSARELEESHQELEAANAQLLRSNEELSNMNLVLEQLSITDGLTKLHNHRYFQEQMAAECKRARRTETPLCLILVDIDYFKRWNDRLGHAGGDEILRRMAEVLNQACRETDLLARYGGEEFAVLALGTPLQGAVALGEKIRQSVEATVFVTDVPSEREQPTVSVGIAAFEGDRRKLFAAADAALYAAKDAGRNRVIVARPSDGASALDPEALPEGVLVGDGG
jgi:diguanylate cyclase (GGDEF)-like protein